MAKDRPEEKKPLSMMEEMKLRMQRRNSAISGKDSKEQTKKDSAFVAAARAAVDLVHDTKLSTSVIIDNNSNKREVKKSKRNNSDSDTSDSDESAASFDEPKVVKKAPPASLDVKSNKPKDEKATYSIPLPPEGNKRSSLVNSETTNKLLSSARQKAESSSDGEDWDN